MHDAITDPTNHAHTAAAGPPSDRGLPNVAGTDPRTPRTEMAYDRLDHFVKCRLSSYTYQPRTETEQA